MAGYLGALLMAGAFVAIGVMASSFTRNQIVAALVALLHRLRAVPARRASSAVLPPSLAPIAAATVDRVALQEHRARGHRHARRPLLRVDHLRAACSSRRRRSTAGGGADGHGHRARPRPAPTRSSSPCCSSSAWCAVNVIAARFAKRIDLTQDHVYTLSRASKDLVAKLPDVLTVKAFISNDLQPPFSQTAQYVRDLLDEYAHASKGKLKWEAIDPGEDAKLEEEATKMKVPKMRRGRDLEQQGRDRRLATSASRCRTRATSSRSPRSTRTEGLEFEIDKRIRMLTQKKTKIAFATSEGELSTTGGRAGARRRAAGAQAVHGLLRSGADASSKAQADPRRRRGAGHRRAEAAVQRARQVRHRPVPHEGQVGRLLRRRHDLRDAAADADAGAGGAAADRPQERHRPRRSPRALRLQDRRRRHPRAAEERARAAARSTGRCSWQTTPTFLVTDSIAKSSPLFEHVDALIVPFASSVELVKDNKTQAGLVYTQLAQSSAQAWRQKGFFLLNPTVPLKPSRRQGAVRARLHRRGQVQVVLRRQAVPQREGREDRRRRRTCRCRRTRRSRSTRAQAPGRLLVIGARRTW